MDVRWVFMLKKDILAAGQRCVSERSDASPRSPSLDQLDMNEKGVKE